MAHFELGEKPMEKVTTHALQTETESILDRVSAGETLLVTRAGEVVAELRPRRLEPDELADEARQGKDAPSVDPEELQRGVDALFDSGTDEEL